MQITRKMEAKTSIHPVDPKLIGPGQYCSADERCDQPYRAEITEQRER